MKTLGIIVEYNPFHNGHFYHLSKAKEITLTDHVIAVMGGNFLQRGEPAIVNKWARTEMALEAGIDLVIELPFVFSTQDANGFAFGAIKLLDSLQIVDYLCFGSENNHLDVLYPISKLLHAETQEFKDLIKEKSKNGYEYPKARAQALCEYHKKFGIKNLETLPVHTLENLLKRPNNILALEYIKHLLNLNSRIKPMPIKRIGAGYHRKTITGELSSATSIRNEIFKHFLNFKDFNLNNKIKTALPDFSCSVLMKEFNDGRNPIEIKSFEQYILALLRKMSLREILQIHGVNEGLENRIKKASLKSSTIEQLISTIKTRRYTRTKIQRILIHIMTNLTKEDTLSFNNHGPLYARVLGFSKKGKKLLKIIKNNSTLPLITKFAHYLKQTTYIEEEQNIFLKMLKYDILSTDLYVLGYQEMKFRAARVDFSHRIVMKDN